MTILVVEDHDAVRRALRDWLAAEFPLCRVITAAGGEEAFELAQTESPRLVVMDITLPGTSGIAVTRQIKSILPATEVVMLTIHDDEVHRADAAAAGANAYVAKQSMRLELVPTMAALLDRSGGCF